MSTSPAPAPSFPGESRLLTDDEQRQTADHDWCLSSTEILQRYAGQIVAVYRQRVWGYGPDHETAVRATEQALGSCAEPEGVPAPDELVYVVIPILTPAPPVPSY